MTYWWQLFAWIESFLRCPNGPVAWEWAPKMRQRYWGSPLVTPEVAVHPLDYQGDWSHLPELTDDQALSWPVRFVPREELKRLYPEPKRKRPRWGKRRVR